LADPGVFRFYENIYGMPLSLPSVHSQLDRSVSQAVRGQDRIWQLHGLCVTVGSLVPSRTLQVKVRQAKGNNGGARCIIQGNGYFYFK